MDERLLKPYNSNEVEDKIYQKWEESGLFNPDICVEKGFTKKDAPTFYIPLPPPNVTGVLHMGHALMLVIEDIMVRYNRMQGKRTLWLPGTDHAAIATQSRVEKDLYKSENKSRHDFGREEFLKRVNKFAQNSHDTIVKQVRKMGASVDWSREVFTLDEKRNFAVRTMFKKMYDDGLIYQGYRIVNWDPKGQTVISDDEIVHEERKAKFYTFKYSKDFPIAISTTRPETKVGDTAVAVNPTDERYQKYIGQEFDLSFCGVPIHIKIIADLEVDKEFGTGALGVTPAHSQADWEIAKRHNLPTVQVINEYAKMTVENSELNNKKVLEAREIIVEWLKKENLLEKEEEVDQNISTAERTGGIIEPLPKLQWFIDVNKKFRVEDSKINGIETGSETTLKEIMIKTVESGQIKILPDHFNKIYFHWIENLRDWCISRQIWYGHRIPVYYCQGTDKKPACAKPLASIEELKHCPHCKGEIIQDPDTLDTWFSSGIWTFSALGWPEKTLDLKTYHPAQMLETGYEIIFFWVARMILMTGYALNDIPFETVYLHGTVRDAKGRKMSKSLGNGIDPIDMIEKYGADAVRMSLIVGVGPGTDSRVSEEKIKGYKHFANKIWNITRFIFTNTEGFNSENVKITANDQKILNDFNQALEEITTNMNNLRYYIAGEQIYQYVWHNLADVILEESKKIFIEGSVEEINSRKYLLLKILENSLKIVHPFMPFITEEIWEMIDKKEKKLLLIENWPI